MDGRANLGRLVDRLRAAAVEPAPSDESDGQLLQRFRRDCDAAAFEQLIRRHGRIVLRACRRQLREPHDVEDCFQAVWLILARKAASIRRPELLASWLYGVARHTAIQARASALRRRARERQAARPEAVAPDTRAEWWEALDRELGRLPEIYRTAVLLCDVEGLAIKEAARRLAWPEGTLAGRLARGRRLLARRLAQAGITLSAAALIQALAASADAAVAPALAIVTADAAALFTGAPGRLAELVSSQGIHLAQEVLRIMYLSKLKVAVALVLALAVSAGIGGALMPHLGGGGPAAEVRAGDGPGGLVHAVGAQGKDPLVSAPIPRPEDKLANTVSVNFKEIPLSEAVAELRKLTKLNLSVDWAALQEQGVVKDQLVSLHLDKVPIRAALRLLLPRRSSYYVADGVLVLTTVEEADTKMVRRVYPVADLVASDSKGENLIDVIRKIVDPGTWQPMPIKGEAIAGLGGMGGPVGGMGGVYGGAGAVAYFAEGRCLVVLQSTRAHEEVAELLAELRASRPAQQRN